MKQATKPWDVPKLKLPSYVCYGSKLEFARGDPKRDVQPFFSDPFLLWLCFAPDNQTLG